MTTTLSAADIDYWKQRWSNKQTGWHQSKYTQTLENVQRSGQIPAASPHTRFLLPLCGASLDILYLYQCGYHVIGVESAEESVQRLFSDNAAPLGNEQPAVTQLVAADGSGSNGITKYSYCTSSHTGAIDIYVSDWFHPQLTAELIGGRCHVVFDRCALVALPHKLHEQYVKRLMQLIEPLPRASEPDQGAATFNLLFQTVEYPPASYNPPPHNLPPAEVSKLFSPYMQHNHNQMTELQRDDRREFMQRRVENLPSGGADMTHFNFIIFGLRIAKSEQ